jgi:phospholipase/carboxylesterase/glyoxalase family protein
MIRAATKNSASELLGFHYVWSPPANGATDHPVKVLLLLHGTGGSEYDLLEMGRALSRTASLLSPRGRVMEGSSSRFFRRFSEGVFDLNDLRQRTNELAEFIVQASDLYGFDRSQVTAVGFSNGANMAASTLLTHPGLIESAILFSPMVPFEPDKALDLGNTSVFIGAGRADAIASPEGAERLATILRENDAGVTMFFHPGQHTITRSEIDAAAEWLSL